MTRHVLSVVSIIAMVLVGSATSFMEELHADIRRTPNSVVITNLDDFDWERVEVIMETSGSATEQYRARVGIGTVAAGETREVLLSQFKDEANLSNFLGRCSNALLYITGICPNGRCSSAYDARLLREVPSVKQPTGR